MRMKITELRGAVRDVLLERGFGTDAWTPNDARQEIDIWDNSYVYNSMDSVDDLVQSALQHQKKMMGQGSTGPSDPKFLNAVQKRLKYLAVPDDVTKSVLFKVRMSK